MKALTRDRNAVTWINSRIIAIATLVAAILVMASGQLLAQGDDHTKPINVKADTSVYDDRRGTQTLSGNVEVTQGSMSISADTIEIEIRDGTLFRIIGTGSPIKFQQMTPNNELITGECNEISYNTCLLYTSPSPRDLSTSRMPSSA